MATTSLRQDVEYPESDGQPIGESDDHRDEIFDLINELDDRYRELADIYVTSRRESRSSGRRRSGRRCASRSPLKLGPFGPKMPFALLKKSWRLRRELAGAHHDSESVQDNFCEIIR